MTATIRNVAIVLALAAVVMLVPGGGNAGSAILQVLVIAMLGSLSWFGARLYREHRSEIYSLGDRNRAVLYGSVGLAAITLVATDRLWDTGPGSIAWLALIALSVYGIYYVFRISRQY